HSLSQNERRETLRQTYRKAELRKNRETGEGESEVGAGRASGPRENLYEARKSRDGDERIFLRSLWTPTIFAVKLYSIRSFKESGEGTESHSYRRCHSERREFLA